MSCQAVERLWWVWERVWKSSLTQESNVAACGFLISCGLPYCGWRWYVFLRKGLSRPFSPHTHTTDPHPTTTLSWSAPARWAPSVINYTNCIDLKGEGGQHIPVLCSTVVNLSVFVSAASVENIKCGLFIVNSHEEKVPFLHSYLNVFALLQSFKFIVATTEV